VPEVAGKRYPYTKKGKAAAKKAAKVSGKRITKSKRGSY